MSGMNVLATLPFQLMPASFRQYMQNKSYLELASIEFLTLFVRYHGVLVLCGYFKLQLFLNKQYFFLVCPGINSVFNQPRNNINYTVLSVSYPPTSSPVKALRPHFIHSVSNIHTRYCYVFDKTPADSKSEMGKLECSCSGPEDDTVLKGQRSSPCYGQSLQNV